MTPGDVTHRNRCAMLRRNKNGVDVKEGSSSTKRSMLPVENSRATWACPLSDETATCRVTQVSSVFGRARYFIAL